MNDPKTGPGTTYDPNQANRTGLPDKADEDPLVTTPQTGDETTDPDDRTAGPGTTSDPNQANRT